MRDMFVTVRNVPPDIEMRLYITQRFKFPIDLVFCCMAKEKGFQVLYFRNSPMALSISCRLLMYEMDRVLRHVKYA